MIDTPPASPGAGDARVRVCAAGICATDLHILAGRIKFARDPRILGHEISGVVESVGSSVPSDWVGKKVIVDPVIGCGFCAWCRSGRKLLCRGGGELGTTGGDGGYAEHLTVPAANLHVLPDSLSFKDLTVVTGIGSPLLWDEVIRLADTGQLDLQSLITHRFPLEDFERALSVAADVEQSVKVVFTP